MGAQPFEGEPCRWTLVEKDWTAHLELDREDLRVTWHQTGRPDRHCSLPYGLPRADVDAAIQAGP